jgi:hypothetical protein
MWGKVLKALYSAAVAVLGSLATVLGDDVTLSDMTAGQWVTISLAGLVAFGGTFGLAGWNGPSFAASSGNGKGEPDG